MIGVDYDLFWTLNPKSLQPFVKAFSLKQKYDDAYLWSLGAYVRVAVASVLSKSANYPTSPYGEQSKEVTMESIKDRFLRQSSKINSKFRKEVNNV